MHDNRCESDWNDGVCACPERADNASRPWYADHTPPARSRRRVFQYFLLHR